MYWSYLLVVVNIKLVISSVVITRHENQCMLDPKLVEEIKSYENVTKWIMDQIIHNGYGDTMWDEYTRFIDKYGARPSGTETLEHAIDHMIDLTKQHGLNDVTTEDVTVPRWKRINETAEMIQPYYKKLSFLGLGMSVSTPPEGITAEVIVVSSFDELDKTEDSKIKGKIVVFDEPFVSYSETVLYRVNGATKAARKGAVATLIRSVTPFSINSPHTGEQAYGENVTKIPTACITLEDADLMHRLQNEGDKIVIKLLMLYSSEEKTSRNTLVDLKGHHPEKMVIVSGHIDSWDVGQGAMDDGGGMMISWFVPVILNKLQLKANRTIRAILWTSEEFGLIGAMAYLNKHLNEFPNIDFIMESDEGTFAPLGLDVSGPDDARCVMLEILKLFTPLNQMRTSDYPGSDIALYIGKGLPGASLLNKNDHYFWYHHSDGDTMNVQNKDDVIKCAAFWAAVTYVIADLSADIPRP